MASTYSEYLRLELIGTGEQTGTWGNTTNTNLGTLLDQAVAGTATIDVTLGDVTLTALNGVSDQSRQAILKVTGTPIAARNVIAPEQSKWYLVSNACGQTITLKGASTTGYAIADGETLLMFWNGTDFVPGSSTALGYTPVNKAGDTMTGNLILNAAPSTGLGAATKQYVDDAVSGAVGGNFVLKTGDTMTGPLVLSGAPSTSLQAATKGYVDSSISGAGYATQSWVTSQNYANTTTQSLVYYYTKTDSDSRYVSVNTQALTYYPLTTTVASTYGALSGSNHWSGANSFTQASSWSGGGYTTSVSYSGITCGHPNNAVVGDNAGTQIAMYVAGSQRMQLYSSYAGFNVPVYINASGPDIHGLRVLNGGYTGAITASGIQMREEGTGIIFGRSGGVGVMSFLISGWGSVASMNNSGNFGVSNQGFKPGGGAWADSSDIRLKENVTPLTGALEKITALNPVAFEWKYDRNNVTNIGFIAQEVEPILPSAVSETEPEGEQLQFIPEGGKVKNIGWQNDMTAYLVGAIKELKAELDAAKAEVYALKAAK